MDEKAQLKAVTRDGYVIRHIVNPSEAVQIAAVLCVPDSIKFIFEPSEAVQLAAVNQYGYALKYIKNPSEKVRRAAEENLAKQGLTLDEVLDWEPLEYEELDDF